MIHFSPQQELGLRSQLQVAQSTETHLPKQQTAILTLPETDLRKIISHRLEKEEGETGMTGYSF